MKSRKLARIIALATLLSACGPAAATPAGGGPGDSPAGPTFAVQTIYAVDTAGRLLSFRTEPPYSITDHGAVAGLQPGEWIAGISFSPEQELYGLGTTSRLYRIDKGAATATEVGAAPFTPGLSGSFFGFSFDPHDYELRVTSDTGSNFRLSVHNGTVIAQDAALAYAAADAHSGVTPQVAVTTSSCDCNLATPTIYGIDAATDSLVTVGNAEGSPNGAASGKLFTVGSLGVAVDLGLGPVALTLPRHVEHAYSTIPAPGGVTRLHRIELSSGRATLLGTIPSPAFLRSASVLP